MPRVSKDTICKLQSFIDSLPETARSKCALCNETLTHIVKMAEAQTGAPTATVTRELAERINECAAPGDVVGPRQLEMRVHRQENNIVTDRDNKPEEPSYRFNEADRFAIMAISQLERIRKNDADKLAALTKVEEWIKKEKEKINGRCKRD